ncbi:MAG: autotransporter domain-containing protein [Luteolibacter sp.]
MKSKYRYTRHVFPSLIVLSAFAGMASADTFTPDTAGNILVPGNFSSLYGQDFTIVASGGTGTSYTAVIESGVVFTGDTTELNAINVTADGYTITNNGTLSGNRGIFSPGNTLTLINNGGITGNSGSGVAVLGGSSITNNEYGVIEGSTSGVRFLADDGGTVTNYGAITGYGTGSNAGVYGEEDDVTVYNYGSITGTNAYGVYLGDNATVENITTYDVYGYLSTAGTISGATSGVRVDDDASITNGIGGTIIGGTNGIRGDDTLTVINSGGTITGTSGFGILAGDDAIISNQSGWDEGFNTYYYGSITGGTRGVEAGGNLTLYNSYGSSITGNGGSGVHADSISYLENYGSITGTSYGIRSEGYAYIYNSGTITGTSESGIRARSLDLTNVNGVITGDTGITTTRGGSTLNFYGGTVTGTGGTAISLGATSGAGDNTVNLGINYYDTAIYGDIIGTGTGNQIISSAGYVEGDISGIQEIEVSSSGYLILQGDINDTPEITVNEDGLLSGAGTWTANITLADGATIEAYDWIADAYTGVLDIAGNVTHDAGSFIATWIQPLPVIANDGTTSTLIRSTSGTYDATDAIITLNNSDYDALRNGTYTIVEAAGGTVLGGGNEVWYNGSDDTVLGNYFATAILNSGGDLVVEIEHDFSDLPGLSRNQSSAGAALDAFMASESALSLPTSTDYALRGFVDYLDNNNLSVTQSYLGYLVAPAEAALALSQSIVNSNYRIHRLVQDHLASVRSAGGVVSIPVGTSSEPLVSAPSSAGGRSNLWGSFSYDWQDYDGRGDFSDFDGESASFTAGYDYRIAPNTVVGLLLDGSRTDVNGHGEDGDIDSFRVSAYGTYGASTGIYADALLGYGTHDNDFTDAKSFQALLTVGYTLGDQQVKHGPFAGLEYQRVDVDGFDTNYLPLTVSVKDYDVDSFRALIGYRVNASYGRFSPYASIAYAHEFEDGYNSAHSTFGPVSYRIVGGEQGSAVLLTAGTAIAIAPSLSLDLGYRGEISVDSYGMDSHGGNIGLNWTF